ncbi:MAG: translation initiation factor IF-2 [Bdellovibrionota bacterium]
MAKVRVYELARELKMESKALLAKLKSLGIEAASHQSTMTLEQIQKVKADMTGGSKPKVVVRRRKKSSAAEAKEENNVAVEADEESSINESPEITIEGSQEKIVAAEEEGAPVSDSTVESVVASSEETAKSENAVDAKPDAVVKPISELSEIETGAISDNDKEELAEVKSVKAKAPSVSIKSKRPKFEGGATIVRKATPKEIEEQKLQDEARQRTARREDSRGVRVTGIGVNTQDTNARRGVDDSVYPDGDVSEGRRVAKGKKIGADHLEEASNDDDRQEQRAKAALHAKRRSQSTRELLSQITDFEEEDTSLQAGRKKRHVFTPSAASRKRDLKRRKDLKSTQITTPRAAYRVVKMTDHITVSDLATQLSVKAGDIIKKLMSDGVIATLNQEVDVDTATLIASDYGFEIKQSVLSLDDILQNISLMSLFGFRPPIVTVMGHVDHGKTSILDALRETSVASGEAGGITQHIGAYSVSLGEKTVSFLDTPGHEAFSAMRSRGAGVTDIVVLVVAADDGVMPQTVEAISHANSANVPIIVAINKMDKPNINLDRVYNELAEHGIQSEEWGGEHQFVKCSAMEKTGLDDLIEAILLQAEMLELKAFNDMRATGSVVEAHLDKNQGPVATVMVTNGTLKKGDILVAGVTSGKVRVMTDHKGKRLEWVGPGSPVRVLGLTDVPMAGDRVDAVEDERMCKTVLEFKLAEKQRALKAKSSAQTLEELLSKVKDSETPEVPLILKGDTQGSVEAICEALAKINTDKVSNKIVHRAVGGVNESDISLAETSGAVILGFNVRATRGLDDLAEKKGVIVNYFGVIYELVDSVKALMAGKLPPIQTEVVLGHAEVRNAINVPKVGTIAGSAVLDGKITRTSHLRLIRDDIVVFDGKLGSLRRFKDDVKEVQNGYECGIGFDGYNDIKVGDVIEAYMIEEVEATL